MDDPRVHGPYVRCIRCGGALRFHELKGWRHVNKRNQCPLPSPDEIKPVEFYRIDKEESA